MQELGSYLSQWFSDLASKWILVIALVGIALGVWTVAMTFLAKTIVDLVKGR